MLAEHLRRFREELGINKRQMAERLGIPYTTYNNYETGIRTPDIQMLIRFADYFGVSLDALLGRTGQTDSTDYEMEKDYAKLNTKGRQKAKEYIKDLLGNTRYSHRKE